ncbi:MAG: hypothetical protein HFP81_07910 [Methylococcales symbiont of Hymedesmia sp. n. MRB-2018]|nr:MAG: hypothetical protein HFP78_08145 [Methylococcales symbiont of Hymedesmia sp. n. MRB-2018]KAF3983285.1 MAG: hypothetical protein HFP81_07910 [Methylococcales symbiont of Hymedesmia sp. n. MRB-2018]
MQTKLGRYFLGTPSVIGAFFEQLIWIDMGFALVIVLATFVWEFFAGKRLANA